MCTKNGYNTGKGSSPELMPSIMGAFDAIIGTQTTKDKDIVTGTKSALPRRSHQVSNFANLSPCVQKILSNVPDQEISKKFNSEESLAPRRFNSEYRVASKTVYRSFRSADKNVNLNKSNDNLDIISNNVQKMLSNLPDTELVISASNLNLSRNSSYLYNTAASRSDFLNKVLNSDTTTNNNGVKQCLYHSDGISCKIVDNNGGDGVVCVGGSDVNQQDDNKRCNENCDNYNQKPLGSYLHSHGIASRTPVGRMNAGKYLQVPSESSVGTVSSTTSTEVSRPVSLTSLGSCSSSGSSGHHQPGSVYLASAESLDSDPEPTGSQGSADSGIAEQEQPSYSPEQRVLQEVLDTETVYVADLKEVIQGYLEKWKADPQCPLAQHLHHLFTNLEEIYNFNRSFLEDLNRAECDPTKTANCFLMHDSGFSVYNEYCTSYPRTMEVLSQLTRDESMAALFREKQLALGHALPLGSYLLKPVQRILKYHLLLQRLSKQCETQHKPTVDLALATMTTIASDINNMKRKHEHAVRVQEIQSQLYGWDGPDLTALGELIAEGTFRVVGARGRRHVFLFDKILLMAKSKPGGALACKSHIMCSNLMLVEQVRGEPLSFQVLPFDNPRLQSTLKARSPQHKREWTLQIKRVILENYSAVIPNHARQLVLQLGQDLSGTEDSSDKWSPLKPSSTPHYLERRSRIRKTRDFSNTRRATSQDRSFPSLGSWRRKSEPSMIPQYSSKTMPKKISKIKKVKGCTKSATFYTDLSDSENFDVIGQSMESLSPQNTAVELVAEDKNIVEVGEEATEQCREDHEAVTNNLGKIVSEILMQNQKSFCNNTRNRKTVTSDPTTTVWCEEEEEELEEAKKVKLVTKADSLPRSFQLNDQIESKQRVVDCKNERLMMRDMSLKENAIPNIDVEEQQENDLTSHLDDSEHPEHKIYRKSAIRFSLLQRIRHIMSEEQKCNHKYPLHKQGSRSMGEKIAHPDYVDPQKLFIGNSRHCSQVNLSVDENDQRHHHEENDIMGVPELLDLTINETEVLNELEKRLNDSTNTNEPDTGQKSFSSSRSSGTTRSDDISSLNSSQNSDSYYESILEDSLTEEYIHDSNGKLVAKQDSFSSNGEQKFMVLLQSKYKNAEKRSVIKRPDKAPPPIPVKPPRLTATVKSNFTTSIETSATRSPTRNSISPGGENASTTSWVKAMVGRFE